MGQLSTAVTRFDVSFILKHYLKPSLWAKKWKIFEYDGYSIYIEMTTIYTYDKSIGLKLEIVNDKARYRNTRTRSVFYYVDEANINVTANKNKLDGEVLRLICDYECEILISETEAYGAALEAEEKHSEMIKRLSNDRLDELGITDKEVRRIYVKNQVYENKVNYTDDVVEKLAYTIAPELYLSYALFADNKQKYNWHLKQIEEQNESLNIELLEKEIKDEIEKIEAGEMDDSIILEEV